MEVDEILKKMESDEDTQNGISGFFQFLRRIAQMTAVSEQILDEVKNSNKEVLKTLNTLGAYLDAIYKKEHPKMPDFPATMEISNFPKQEKMKMPEYPSAKEIAIELVKVLKPLFDRKPIVQIVEKEKEAQVPVPVKTSAANIKHIKSKWIIASNANNKLVGSVDGSNATFYLPSVPIKDSEEVRLNMGLAMAEGIDYTITGLKLEFVVAPPTGSNIQVKYQS